MYSFRSIYLLCYCRLRLRLKLRQHGIIVAVANWAPWDYGRGGHDGLVVMFNPVRLSKIWVTSYDYVTHCMDHSNFF
jgi:hypothetical protein